MTDTLVEADFKSKEMLEASLPHILDAPRDAGRLEAIVVRPEPGERRSLDTATLSLSGGVHGDRWARGAHILTDDGLPHPDVQICIMGARTIRAIAGDPQHWPMAGDNLFIDMDLSPENLPTGTRLTVGSVELTVTEEPHKGCIAFVRRYGRDAGVFVNTGRGRDLRLRGIYARVSKDGTVSVGDMVRKLDDTDAQ